ncbi:hypothetical protein RJ639_019888 [Escallonia herrerae]|uniref:VQ domain-containing protein n=1 Tax=Escallonia herrerae TaxID=1293975 RepID=A0AA88V7W1_9ASTE|nr:hypothetical protein RJ639_019888 [Escallonia herrerae]
MDKLRSVHQNKATKQTKPKKKPVKVVYISNPMRVKTSASEFRALVQELTGQDADLPDPSKYPEILDSHPVDPRAMKLTDELKVAGVEAANELPNQPDLPFEHYDDVFMPQMLENFQDVQLNQTPLMEMTMLSGGYEMKMAKNVIDEGALRAAIRLQCHGDHEFDTQSLFSLKWRDCSFGNRKRWRDPGCHLPRQPPELPSTRAVLSVKRERPLDTADTELCLRSGSHLGIPANEEAERRASSRPSLDPGGRPPSQQLVVLLTTGSHSDIFEEDLDYRI